MDSVFIISVVVSLLCHPLHAADIELTADPQELIPVLTPSMTVTCSPGLAADSYREIYFLQLTKDEHGSQTAVASLRPGQAPVLYVTDPNMVISGSLTEGSPATARLEISVHNPTQQHAGQYHCEVEGLGDDGQEVYKSAVVNVTVHPQADVANIFLKVIVARLREETEALQEENTRVLAATQQLQAEITAKRTELQKRRADLEKLRVQVQELNQRLTVEEALLNVTAGELLEKTTNLSADAPGQRVAFSVTERTERTYGSGVQVVFETVELNEGNGYNVTTSTFSPPLHGVYFLSSTQLTHDLAGPSVRGFSIHANATVLSSTMNNDDRQGSQYQQSTVSTIAALGPADVVSVFQQISSTTTSNLVPYYNTIDGKATGFNGYILFRL